MAEYIPPRSPPTTAAPFETRLFGSRRLAAKSHPSWSTSTTLDGAPASDRFYSLKHYPVSFRAGVNKKDTRVVDGNTFNDFLESEFSLKRLEDIETKLWRVGLPRAARPLNTQVELGRTIVLTNNLDMHLVWGGGKLFLKPLPRYLLEPEFWTNDLGTGDLEKVRKSALGFLYTYACLITYPADLKLALERGLVPNDDQAPIDWVTWRALATEVLDSETERQMHSRWQRAELRLDRLNWIYVFSRIPSFRLYHNPWRNYTHFVVSNLAWITALTVYIVVVLTAMEVGLSTSALKDNEAFNRASYGFTVFAILGPIIALASLLLALLAAVIPNWKNARAASRNLGSPPGAPKSKTSKIKGPFVPRRGDGEIQVAASGGEADSQV